MKAIIVIYLLILLLTLPKSVSAQVVINEVLNNPVGPESGAEWVELFNKSEEPASLKDCVLHLDDSASTQKIIFSEEDFVDQFKVVSWDGSWLNNSGDLIKLECTNYIDQVLYGDLEGSVIGTPKEGITFGRSPDGHGNYSFLSRITMGEANSDPTTSTPLPTVTQQPTKKPTNTSKPEKTSTPVPTTNIMITNNETPYVDSVSVLAETDPVDEQGEKDKENDTENNMQIGFIETVAGITDKPKDDRQEVLVKGNKKANIFAAVFVVIGLLILSYSFFPVIKDLIKRYNSR